MVVRSHVQANLKGREIRPNNSLQVLLTANLSEDQLAKPMRNCSDGSIMSRRTRRLHVMS